MVIPASLLFLLPLLGPPHDIPIGPRSAGMGYIGVSSSTGIESFYYNPSGISFEKGWRFDVFGVTDEGGMRTAGFLMDRGDDMIATLMDPSMEKFSSILGDERVQDISQTLLFSSTIGYLSGKWAAMIRETGVMASEVRSLDPTGLDTHLSFSLDGELEVRGGLSQKVEILGMEGYLGLAMKYLQVRQSRRRVDEETVKELVGGIADDLSSPISGLGFDIGIRLSKDPIFLGLSLMDIYGTSLRGSKTSYHVRQSLNFGISFGRPGGPIAVGFDVLDLLGGGDMLRKVQVGMEGRPFGFISFRLGMNDGYPCLGLGIRFSHVSIDYSKTGVEVGSRIGEVEKEYHMISVSYRF